jgi:integrase
LVKSGLSLLSVRKAHAILSAAFNQAVKWDLVDRSPVVRSSPPSARGREIVPPTPDEVGRLLEACEQSNPDLTSLIYVAVTTGCRRGELRGLRWGDVDLATGSVVVSRAIPDAGGIVGVKGTKTHQARRHALDPFTIAVLQDHRDRVDDLGGAAGVMIDTSSCIWSQDLGASIPYQPDRVTGTFRTITRRLDMPHVTFHTLRHFSATTLAGHGVGVRTIADRLGHANPSVTLNT